MQFARLLVNAEIMGVLYANKTCQQFSNSCSRRSNIRSFEKLYVSNRLYSACVVSRLNILNQKVARFSSTKFCGNPGSVAPTDKDLSSNKPIASTEPRDTVYTMRQLIYCGGPLLDAVQKSKIFHDCKHFVDMPLRGDAEATLNDWQNLVAMGNLDVPTIRQFVEQHFDEPGCELVKCDPTDFDPDTSRFDFIKCSSYRQWAKELHGKWPSLCRKVCDKVHENPSRYSLIALPNPFVVPGGRFREMYYWDSFFTIKGLLASGMFQTVRGMIENMGFLIQQFGYVPNGNRVYYLNRSQPPLLTWCLSAYYTATKDEDFLREAIGWIEKEMTFFQEKRSIALPNVSSPLFRYQVIVDGPRPESYREDIESADHLQDLLEKQRLWGDIAAAAESGRDFSSRWFAQEGPVAGKMGSTRTSSILPIDLNAIICGNWKILINLYQILGEKEKAEYCTYNFSAMRQAIHQVFWNEDHGCWFDFDIIAGNHVKTYMDTNFFPLYTECTHEGFNASVVAAYLANVGVLQFPGGLPSSLIASGQQWDFPNAWAPTTWIVIQGLRACGEVQIAKLIAEKWIRRNYFTWLGSGGRMFEKYNVASECHKSSGGGGEYEIQEGFGWTNGVILDLLFTYGNELEIGSGNNGSICPCCTPAKDKEQVPKDKQIAGDQIRHCSLEL